MLTKTGEDTATWMLGCSISSEIGIEAFSTETRAVGNDNINAYENLEYQFRYNVRTACTARYFRGFVWFNSRDKDVSYTVAKNGVATDITFTIPAEQNGWFSDTTHEIAFDVGDKISLICESPESAVGGDVLLYHTHLQMDSDSSAFDIVAGGNAPVVLYNGGSYTTEQGVSGQGSLSIQTDFYGPLSTSLYALKFPMSGTLSNLAFSYTNFGVYEGFTDMGFYARTMIGGVQQNQRINVDDASSNPQVGSEVNETDEDAVASGDEYYVEFGLRHPNNSDADHGTEVDIWFISASFSPTDNADEFGCYKTCDGSETYYSLVNKTLKMLGEDPDAPVYWTSAEIGRYVNDAYGDMAVETKGLEFIEAVTLTSDVSTGTMSGYVMQPFRVTFDDYKLIATSKYELDRVQTDWENLEGYVDRYLTGLNDRYDITTYKAWDGREFYAREFFFNDGATTYTTWADATAYVVGDRVKVTHADGYVNGFECISAHTSDTATNKPVTGSGWTDKWVPLALMVWATKTPADLSACDEPEFPCWSHISIAYKAAAKALRKYGEQKNDALADAYDAIGETYWELVRNFMSNRTPEQTLVVGARTRVRGLRPWPWPPLVEV